MRAKERTAISLFSGCGGMDVGAKRAGFKLLIANEMDENACKSFAANHANVEIVRGDIRSEQKTLKKHKGASLVFGGPPCQGFSVAGKMRDNDERSSLIFSFCEVVESISPDAFVMENVKTLVTLKRFEKVKEKFIKRMSRAGYETEIVVLNAKDFGVPQKRERAFFLGFKKKGFNPKVLEKFKKAPPSLREAIKHLGEAGSKTNFGVPSAKITFAKNPILRTSPYAGMMFNGQGRPQQIDGLSTTLPASMGGNRTPIIDEESLESGAEEWIIGHHKKLLRGEKTEKDVPKRLRRMTTQEAAAVQTFPKNYIFIGPQTSIFRQIGNAVPCNLAEAVFKSVFEFLKD